MRAPPDAAWTDGMRPWESNAGRGDIDLSEEVARKLAKDAARIYLPNAQGVLNEVDPAD